MIKMNDFCNRFLMILLALGVLCLGAQAKEGRGSWDRESKAAYLIKLIDTLKIEQDERIARLEKEFSSLVPTLAYPHFDKFNAHENGKASIRENFLRGRLNAKQKAAFFEGVRKDLQDNQTKLYAAEKKAAALWKPEDKAAEDSDKEYTAEIFGQKVSAMRLGVILDNSHSMAPYMPVLRKKIEAGFPYCYFVEVKGCRIVPLWCRLSRPISQRMGLKYEENMQAAWFFADPGVNQNPFLPHWHSPEKLQLTQNSHGDWVRLSRNNFSAMLAMSHLLELDSIYWFSDFQDETTPRMRKLLLHFLAKKKVKLYLHSHDKRPHADLVKYARSSGGAYKKKKIKLEE